jgi:rubrerythrin
MNLLNIVNEIEGVEQGIHDRLNPRRAAIKGMFNFGSKLAVAAMPFAMGGFFNKAYAQAPGNVKEILNFALTLEYLEAEFYTKGVAASGLIPNGPALNAMTTIRDHENQHVDFLKTALGADAVSKPGFDFTAGGAFGDVFSNYDTFLALAQVFEDTGVRAYKGQAGGLISNKDVLTAALNIHSVEARHAAHLRQMRRARGGAAENLKPWITGANDTGIGAAVDAIYAGEDNKSQAGVDITQLNGAEGKLSVNAATASFDEPLTAEAVLAIVKPFII